ncbi:Unknown protein sequence [Pseudomonas syringae pv. maculicola]|nr:Unknown protein sequence [Pseudomonas syringae pv. maculicola]
MFFGKLRSQETIRLQKRCILRGVTTSVSLEMIYYVFINTNFMLQDP